MKQRTAILLSGALWLAIGIFLLYKGLYLIPGSSTLIAVGLLVGFLKGRLILPKSVRRIVARIQALPEPISLKQLYPPSYWILIGSMVGLGLAARLLPNDIRGFIDIAIGAALMNGAMFYFRATYDTKSPSQSP